MRLIAIIEHAVHLLCRDARVLQRVGGVLVAELALDSRDVTGLLDDVPSHGVACAVRGLAGNADDGADLIPNGVDGPDAQPALAVAAGVARQEEGRGGEVLGVCRSLMRKKVPDSVEPISNVRHASWPN